MQTVQLVTLVKILLVHCLCHHIDIIYLLMCLGFCPSTVYGSPNVWQLGDHVSSREGIRPWGNSWRVSRANLRWLIISIVWTCDLLHYMHIWIPYCLINIILPIMCIFEPLSLRPLIA